MRGGRRYPFSVSRSRSLALALALSLASTSAFAERPAPTPERLKSAGEEFDQGRRFFLANQFEEAAVHFENAYHDAPSVEALRLAIKARAAAKQGARASTLAAQGVLLYPDDAALKTLAAQTIDATRAMVHHARIRCALPCEVAVDGRVVSLEEAREVSVYLDPGSRKLVVSFGSAVQELSVPATAGGESRHEVEAPKAVPKTDPKPRPSAPVPGPTPPPSTKPFGKGVFCTAAGITVLAGAGTIVSGILTLNSPGKEAVRQDCVGLDESCPTYKQGKNAELRTNVLLVTTSVFAAATVVIGIFTQWSSPASPSGPAKTGTAPTFWATTQGGGAGLTGRF